MASVKLSSKSVGSIVKLKENGALVEFYVAKHDYESGLNGAGRTLLVRKDYYDNRQWNSSTASTYASSSIDSWLNSSYKNMLDASVRAAMGTTKVYYTPGEGNWAVTTLTRSVFLLSVTELGQSNTYCNVEGSALPIASTLKVAYLNGSASVHLTRSPCKQQTGLIWFLNRSGSPQNSTGQYTGGNRPAFTLPSSAMISDDGTVSTNTAPSAPGSISVPSSIQGGAAFSISWGASTDAEGNLSGYKAERSTNGGSSWTQIYQGGSRSTSDTVPFGTSSVMYRVKAYDSAGLESGWRTSGQVMVSNNHAPSAPSGISVPAAVNAGMPLAVSWGPASDSDGDAVTYSLERQVDGGSWTELYSGAAQTYTDTPVKGWRTAAYRVRAKDSQGAWGPYTVSDTREVNNNLPPSVSCGEEADLGTKSGPFQLAYSVSDEEEEEIAVTERIDGAAHRSFTASSGQEAVFQVTAEDFLPLLNGSHTLEIAASDGQAETVRAFAFTKALYAASVTLAQPLEADGPITVCAVSVTGSIPADVVFSVEVTNNALDEAPVWEDCTAAVRAGANHVFSNKAAAGGFAFNFRLAAERGDSGGGYITSIQGGFQ